MSYITREDGERFVIPAYRDVLSAKNKSQLKKDINLLSQSYGEYITMQKKNAMQYEVAFSPDVGYLLGESVWQYFKKPDDLVYCEAVPGSTEVLLTIVKDGSVYLDGSFPAETIQEELVVFLTQDSHFDIYVYGDVPIAEHQEDDKFSFEPKSVKQFTVLDQPIFQKLPLVSSYKLKLADQVLKEHGVGGTPFMPIIVGAVLLVGIYVMWTSFSSKTQKAITQVVAANPYQGYIGLTKSVRVPDEEIRKFNKAVSKVLILPGWLLSDVSDNNGTFTAKVLSTGGSVKSLYAWAAANNFQCGMDSTTFTVSTPLNVTTVDKSNQITSVEAIIATVIDRVAEVNPGPYFKLTSVKKSDMYKTALFDVELKEFAPMYIDLVAKQFKDLPVFVREIKGTIKNGIFNGKITFTALGN